MFYTKQVQVQVGGSMQQIDHALNGGWAIVGQSISPKGSYITYTLIMRAPRG